MLTAGVAIMAFALIAADGVSHNAPFARGYGDVDDDDVSVFGIRLVVAVLAAADANADRILRQARGFDDFMRERVAGAIVRSVANRKASASDAD